MPKNGPKLPEVTKLVLRLRVVLTKELQYTFFAMCPNDFTPELLAMLLLVKAVGHDFHVTPCNWSERREFL